MNVASRWARFVALLAVVGMSAMLGLVLSGCVPAPSDKPGQDAGQPAPSVTTKPADVPTEQPTETAPEEPAAPALEEMIPPPAETPSEPTPETPAPPPAEPEEKAAPEQPTPPPAEPMAEPAPETSEQPAAEPTEKPAAEESAAAAPKVAVDPAKISTYAPAKDLAGQVEGYLKELDKAVENEDEFTDSQSKLVKDANVLILIAIALGLHDEDNPYKKAAPAMLKAAKELAAATDYAAAKAGVEAVKAAAASSDGDPSTLEWGKEASMAELMKAVPLIHSRLKRYLRGSRFKKEADTTAGLTAVIAVVSQGSMANAEDTEKPTEVEKWHAFCVQMRDAAASVHSAIRAQDEAGATAAMEKLQQSCEDCHAVFHPGVVIEEEQ